MEGAGVGLGRGRGRGWGLGSGGGGGRAGEGRSWRRSGLMVPGTGLASHMWTQCSPWGAGLSLVPGQEQAPKPPIHNYLFYIQTLGIIASEILMLKEVILIKCKSKTCHSL